MQTVIADFSKGATLQLVNTGRAIYLQRALRHLREAGRVNTADGTERLVKLFRRTRPSSYRHSVRVARLARATGRALGFDEMRLRALAYAAVLHDVGKILIPERILGRPRKLTSTERFLLNRHPSLGALLATWFNVPAELRIRTKHHHERWDGKGYPDRLGGEDIPLMARIVQVADTYDAMVTDDRPYRSPLSHDAAILELRGQAGKQFDPRVVEAFADTVR